MKFKQFRKMSPLDDGSGGGAAVSDDTGEALGTSNDARVALLNKINDANDALRADEYANINDDGSTEAFTVQNADGSKDPLADELAPDPEADAEIARLAAESQPPAPPPARRPSTPRCR